jgi:hypothetical protein
LNASRPEDLPEGRWGTLAAGIAAAATNNNQGIAGMSWGAKIMPLQVMQLFGTPPALGIIPANMTEAICYAADNGAKIIVAIGWFSDTADPEWRQELSRQTIFMAEAVDYARLKGAVVVAPAGDCRTASNCGATSDNPPIYPANLSHVIGVQAVNPANTEVSPTHASFGPWVDLTAPGRSLVTTDVLPGKPYTQFGATNGASGFAAPHVAGALAVMLSMNPSLTPYQLSCQLCAQARREAGGPFDQQATCGLRNDVHGCGLLDLEALVEHLQPQVRVLPPSRFVLVTDAPNPVLRFANPYLNTGVWELLPDPGVLWLITGEVTQVQGDASVATATIDVAALKDQAGGVIQAGHQETALLRACPIADWGPNACTQVRVDVRYVQAIHPVYLPRAGG